MPRSPSASALPAASRAAATACSPGRRRRGRPPRQAAGLEQEHVRSARGSSPQESAARRRSRRTARRHPWRLGQLDLQPAGDVDHPQRRLPGQAPRARADQGDRSAEPVGDEQVADAVVPGGARAELHRGTLQPEQPARSRAPRQPRDDPAQHVATLAASSAPSRHAAATTSWTSSMVSSSPASRADQAHELAATSRSPRAGLGSFAGTGPRRLEGGEGRGGVQVDHPGPADRFRHAHGGRPGFSTPRRSANAADGSLQHGRSGSAGRQWEVQRGLCRAAPLELRPQRRAPAQPAQPSPATRESRRTRARPRAGRARASSIAPRPSRVAALSTTKARRPAAARGRGGLLAARHGDDGPCRTRPCGCRTRSQGGSCRSQRGRHVPQADRRGALGPGAELVELPLAAHEGDRPGRVEQRGRPQRSSCGLVRSSRERAAAYRRAGGPDRGGQPGRHLRDHHDEQVNRTNVQHSRGTGKLIHPVIRIAHGRTRRKGPSAARERRHDEMFARGRSLVAFADADVPRGRCRQKPNRSTSRILFVASRAATL